MDQCPKIDKETEVECDKKCEKVYDEYTQKLEKRYESDPTKFDQKVSGLPTFDKRDKPHTQTLFYKIFNKPFSEIFGSKKSEEDSTKDPN